MAVMLSVASGMAFGDAMGLREFSLAHRFAHAANAQAIVAQFGVAVAGFDMGDERVISEWALLMGGQIEAPTQGMRDWLALHSLVHEDEYKALGFGIATNLIDVNFADRGQFDDWMQAHQQSHDQVSSALGIA